MANKARTDINDIRSIVAPIMPHEESPKFSLADLHETVLHMYKSGASKSEIREKLRGASDSKIDNLITTMSKTQVDMQRKQNLEYRKMIKMNPDSVKPYKESFFTSIANAVDVEDIKAKLARSISKYGKGDVFTRDEIKTLQDIVDICMAAVESDSMFMQYSMDRRVLIFLMEMSHVGYPMVYSSEKISKYGSILNFSPKLMTLYQQKDAAEIVGLIGKYLIHEEKVFPVDDIDTKKLYGSSEELQKRIITHGAVLNDMDVAMILAQFKEGKGRKVINKTFDAIDEFIKNYKPHSIIEYLDKHIVGQEEAKRVAALTLYTHVCMVKYPEKIKKHNAIMFGPSGSGKTEIWRVLKQISPIPIIIRDAGDVTSRGFSGADFSAMLSKILASDPSAAFGIVILDEFDKAAAPKFGRDGGNVAHEVQASFLKALEDGEVMTESGSALNVKLVTFVLVGVFEGMIQDGGTRRIGFSNSEDPIRANKLIEGFTSFGVMPEILRRITFFAKLRKLTIPDYISILNNKEISPISMMESQYMTVDQISLTVEEGAKEAVANYAFDTGLGASEMTGVLQSVGWSKYIKALSEGYQTVEITRDDVEEEMRRR